jgi:hypothetical protein
LKNAFLTKPRCRENGSEVKAMAKMATINPKWRKEKNILEKKRRQSL